MLRRMGSDAGCLAIGVLSAALRRALASPLAPCWLSAEEVRRVVMSSGGDLLLEDCGFERYLQPPPPPPPLRSRAPSPEPIEHVAPKIDAGPRVDTGRGSPKLDAPSRVDTGLRKKAAPKKMAKPLGLSALEERLWGAFEMADRDRSGTLSMKEFTQASPTLTLTLTLSMIECTQASPTLTLTLTLTLSMKEFTQASPRYPPGSS